MQASSPEGKWFNSRSINTHQERQHGKGQCGNRGLFFSMTFRRQTLTPADFWVPTLSRYSSAGVTSTPSLFCGFLSGFSTPSSAARGVCHVALWKELSSGQRRYTRFPRSPALPADLLLAHCSEQEVGAAGPASDWPLPGFLWSLRVIVHAEYLPSPGAQINSWKCNRNKTA